MESTLCFLVQQRCCVLEILDNRIETDVQRFDLLPH